jgi:hypothetical protein
MMPAKKLARYAVASGIAFSATILESPAAEYALTTYPLGSLSFDAGITPPPGVYVTDVVSYYQGSIGDNFDFGGRLFDGGVKLKPVFDGIDVLLVPQTKVLGGNFGVGFTVPAGYITIDARASAAPGTILAQTQGGGWGDTNLQFQLGWDSESFSHTFYLLGEIPTGRYKTGFAPILGFNRTSVDFGWGFTYFDKNSKLQFNGAVGFMTSIENFATQYQTGNEFHFEWAIGYKFDNGLMIGVAGYDYRQVTGDSGPGALLGPFEGIADAIGPCVSYSTKIGETPVTINIRDYEQYNTKHFFQGNASIASVTAAFPAEKPLK